MSRVLKFLFTLSVLLLVLGGGVMVATQLVALVAGRGDWLEGIPETVGPPTLVSASVAGILAFALSYGRAPQDEHGEESREENGASQAA
jgi:hypothetical protein